MAVFSMMRASGLDSQRSGRSPITSDARLDGGVWSGCGQPINSWARPGLCVPQDLRYKRKAHELSSLYPSGPEPRLHLLSVVRPEVRYDRVGAAEVPCE